MELRYWQQLLVASSRRSVTSALLFFARSPLFALRPNELNAWANKQKKKGSSFEKEQLLSISAIAFSKGQHKKLSCKISLLVVSRFSHPITAQFIYDLLD